MSQVINTNILSLNAQRNLNSSQGSLATSLERLSSGLRINSAKDDAAGLAIAERFTSQIRGLDQAQRNANDGISFAQTAEGALGEIGNALQRIRELSVQAANDSNSSSDRQALNNEVQQLVNEVNRVAESTQFNGQDILDGSLQDLVFQVGANRNQTISVSGVDSRGANLGAGVVEGGTFDLNAIGDNGDGTFEAGDLDDISINGVSIDLSDAGSVGDVVNAVNAVFGETGVQAVRSTTVETEALGFTAPDAGETGAITINGVDIAVDETSDAESVVESINARSTQTGVTAELDGGEIVLRSSSDIEVAVSDEGTTLDFGGLGDGDSNQFVRGIELQGDVGATIDVGGTDAENLGLDGVATEDFTLNGVSVQTRADATDAIRTVDFALQQVSGLRAELGAVQVRFESTIANLSVGSENLSAARSRIQDADFASETAALTRAQILQQAGTSVLAQANAVPQNVLALLG